MSVLIIYFQAEYLDLYGEKFDFRNKIRFKHKIIQLEKNIDYEKTGKWRIVFENIETGIVGEEVFDGVMVCTGHHVYPNEPEFENQDIFKGQIIHSHSYRRPDIFQNKRVVVVGIGNSGGDLAVELSTVAAKV